MSALTQITRYLLFIAFLVAVLTWGYAEAGETCGGDSAAGTILVSDHWDHDEDYNEDHWPSLYGRCNGWTAGSYENSYEDTAVFVGYEWGVEPERALDASITLGLLSGYGDKLQAPIWGSLNLRVGYFKTWIVPGVVTGFGLEYRF
jgi:hypothetical protein